MLKPFCALILASLLLGFNDLQAEEAAEPSPGETAYNQNCAACHDQAVYKAPSRLFLGMLGPDNILHAMNDGVMMEQASALDADTRAAIAEYISGKKPGSQASRKMPPACTADDDEKSGHAAASLGWGVDPGNSRFHPAAQAGLSVEDVPNLKVKWAFAYPNSIQARSQPVVANGRVYVGSQDGTVYALDAETGCLHWTYSANAEVRTAIVISPAGSGRQTLFFGDIIARAHAVDAETGKGLWMTKVDGHPNATITGTPTLFGERLFVPVSSLEVAVAANPAYACCTFRGSLVALSASNGEELWRTYTVETEPAFAGKTTADTDILAPSGAPLWNSPTIDMARQQIYVGSGENYSSPSDDQSDAIIAMDIATGKKAWVSQQTQGDAWNAGCLIDYTPDPANCPEENGPDFDFAASPMLLTLPDGKDIIVAGQKSGDVIGIDPDSGKTLWKTRVGRGGVQGGVHFGMAAEGSLVYVPISDMYYPEDVTRYKFTTPARPGIYGVDAASGKILWSTPAEEVCGDLEYCDEGISQAVTAIPGAVIAGHMNGRLAIYRGEDGKKIWELDTLRDFDTVSGETARGGSFGGGGPVVADGTIFVNSGYGLYFHMPGNVLLAIAPETD